MSYAEVEPPTEEDVYRHIDSIPPKFRKCAAARHNWQAHDWTGYRGGNPLKPGTDPRKATVFEVTEICGGPQGCGLKRHQSFKVAGERVYDKSGYTYSDRNEILTSPRGVSQTGISVRSEVANANLLRTIFQKATQLAPAGETKKALSGARKGRAA